jgi:hypothetical protein
LHPQRPLSRPDSGAGECKRASAITPGRAKRFGQADGHGSRYVHDVRSWTTDEPALDMTATAIAAAAGEVT